jgi:hypothetical protein
MKWVAISRKHFEVMNFHVNFSNGATVRLIEINVVQFLSINVWSVVFKSLGRANIYESILVAS